MGDLILSWPWPPNKHSYFPYCGVGGVTPDLGLSRKAYASAIAIQMAPAREVEAKCPRTFWAHKTFDKVAVWFQQIQTDLGRARADNRTRRMRRRPEAAKRDIPSHALPFSFARMSGKVRIAYASDCSYILGVMETGPMAAS